MPVRHAISGTKIVTLVIRCKRTMSDTIEPRDVALSRPCHDVLGCGVGTSV